MRIAAGADHEGYALKDEIVRALREEGHEVDDLGTCGPEPVDYPDYARTVGNAVRSGNAERGILVCGSGVGACVAANKIPGVRAGACHDTFSAHQGVEDDDINVLCLGARVVGVNLALEVLDVWLKARFSEAPRHKRRLNKVLALEAAACGKRAKE